ncbi:MAG: hypothetical protein K2P81_09370 [Bacteriovoracaceae bacterium]|nr:hypothetical protein [Bacteriovoracaceae bacterium]
MNKISLVLAILFVGCSQPKKIVTEVWLKGRERFVADRFPAADANASCRSDLFKIEEVKREALYYEGQLSSAKKITGKWKHLDLSKLPLGQAKFLQAMTEKIGDLNRPDLFNYSDCSDAPCVVNKVYQSSDGLEGWTTYLWYLKMGSILTFKNKVYDQKSPTAGIYNEKSYELKDYLYSRDELYAFWRMSHALSTPYKSLPQLTEIQRIPRKSTIEDMGPMTCGLAWSTGYILLNDGCLSFAYNSKDSGFIYEGATHEMGHQIDYEWGRQQRNTYYSQNGEWKEKGGWSIKEYVDQGSGKMVREWSSSLKDEQFVRSYAKTSPAEHFADTTAYYRYEGDLTKRKIPSDIYNLIQEKVFEKNEFNGSGLIEQFKEDVNPLLASTIFKSAVECDQNPIASPSVSPLAADLFPFNVSIEVRKCLKERVGQIANQAVVEAKLNHVDGCETLKSTSSLADFKRSIEASITSQMVNHLKAARENQEYYKKLNAFYKNLSERAAPLRLMTECYGDLDEKSCYELGISNLIDELIPKDIINAQSMKDDLRKMFVDANKFEAVKSEMIKVHQDFIFTQSSILNESAKQLWKDCSSQFWSNQVPPIPGPFSVGEAWMVSSQFNCISFGIPDEVKSLVSRMSFEAIGVHDERESKLLFDLAIPIYTKEINRYYFQALESEALEIKKILAANTIEENLSSSFSWITGLGEQVRKDCDKQARSDLPGNLRYHDPAVVFDDLVSQACSNVLKSQKFNEWLESQQGMVEEHVMNSFLNVLEEKGLVAAKACSVKFPTSTLLQRLQNKKAREECLNKQWSQIVDLSWKDVLAGTTLKVDVVSIKQKADFPSKRVLGNVKRSVFVD